MGARAQRGIYSQHLYRFDRVEPSYWEATGGPVPVGCDQLAQDVRTDVAVIGGGLTGLSAAIHLARDHGLGVRVLEAGPIGWGASGRNGGFCCLGSTKMGYAEIARRFGQDELATFFAQQKAGIALVDDLASAYRIDVQKAGSGELILAHRPSSLARMCEHSGFVKQALGESWPVLTRGEVESSWTKAAATHGGMVVPHGFGLHPLRYVRGLARAASEEGARLHERSPVTRWAKEGDHYRLVTPQGSVLARKVLIATNGFTREGLHPELDGTLLPALSSIIVTRPLTAAEKEAQGWHRPALVADSRRLLFYTRLLPDGRFLFGSRGGTSGSGRAFERRITWMRRRLGERFPAWRDVAIDYSWWGLVCLARDRLPHVASLPDDPGITVALAYHGNGVAMSGHFGRAAAALIAGKPQPAPLASLVRQPPPRFPLPGLRLAYLRAAYLGYTALDEWLG